MWATYEEPLTQLTSSGPLQSHNEPKYFYTSQPSPFIDFLGGLPPKNINNDLNASSTEQLLLS